MRNSQEITDEILRRAEILERRDAAIKRKIYSVAAAVVGGLALTVGLWFAICAVVSDSLAADMAGGRMRRMFDSVRLGYYVLISVIGFSLGASWLRKYQTGLRQGQHPQKQSRSSDAGSASHRQSRL